MTRSRCVACCTLLLLLAGCAAQQPKQRLPADLLNPFLGPAYATWLEGAVARMCTPEELSSYLALRDDAAAERAVEAFWERRNPHPGAARNTLREVFDKRAAEADKRFSESGHAGRATDRGAVFVLHGEPSDTHFDAGLGPRDPDVEVWVYKQPAARGLGGHPPQEQYRFARVGDVTVYVGSVKRPPVVQSEQ